MGGYRVLFVDDEAPIRHWFASFAEHRGDSCRVTGDGNEALELLAEFDADVLIADLHMPTMGGLELIHLAKEIRPHLAAIVLTGMGTRENTIASIKEGVFDFIEKPIMSTHSFSLAIERAGDHARMHREREDLLRSLSDQNEELQQSLTQLKHAYGQLHRRDAALRSDLENAQHMQRKMLPAHLPRVGAISSYGYYCPCSWVGGDFFDYLPLDDARQVLYIADVTGHGVRAAMVTVILRELIHSERRARTQPGLFAQPARALAWLNRAILEQQLDQTCLVTLAYALIDGTRGKIQYASAGHPPPLLRTEGGPWQPVLASGPALGVELEQPYNEIEIDFPPGSALLLYSDGLSEVVGAEAGSPSLEEFSARLQRSPEMPAALLGGQVERLFGEQLQGQPPADDVSFVVLHHAPHGQLAPHMTPLHNGHSVKVVNLEQVCDHAVASDAYLSVGWATQICVLRLVGRCTWKLARLLLAEVEGAIQHRAHTVCLDLEACSSLDSTLLGLFYKLAPVLTLHGVTPNVREQIREVGIERHLNFSMMPPPAVTYTIRQEETAAEPWEQNRLMLSVHELLSTVSPANKGRFDSVVELLERSLNQS